VYSALHSISAVCFQALIQSEVWNGSFEGVVDFAQNVVDAVAIDDLGVVGVDDRVGDAVEGGGEVDGEFLEGFGCAGAEDEEGVLSDRICGADYFVIIVEGRVCKNLRTGQETVVEEGEEDYHSDYYLESPASA
jgi:hypothetical protein